MNKEVSGGKRTRRVNAWAKAAGEYYRSHKNDPDIQEFSDVLKSPKFKAYYQSKYGKKSSRSQFNSTKRVVKGRFDRTRRSNKTEKKREEEADDWSWGWESDKKKFKEEEQEQEENQKEQQFQKNELFNGGKKGGKKNSKKGGVCSKENFKQEQEQQQQEEEEQQEE
jgi:hypothetical protein